MKFKSVASAQQQRFSELRPKILTALGSIEENFRDLGEWLTEIRDKKLYRFEFATFAAFCDSELPFRKSRAYQLIEASVTIRELPEHVHHGGINERQARELAKVQPAERVEVLEKAAVAAEAEERPMTARDIQEAAEPEQETETVPRSRTMWSDIEIMQIKSHWNRIKPGTRKKFLRWLEASGELVKLNIKLQSKGSK